MFSVNRNTQKNMLLLDEIHTVFTAAIRFHMKLFYPHRVCPLRACINDVRKIKIGKSKIKNKGLIS